MAEGGADITAFHVEDTEAKDVAAARGILIDHRAVRKAECQIFEVAVCFFQRLACVVDCQQLLIFPMVVRVPVEVVLQNAVAVPDLWMSEGRWAGGGRRRMAHGRAHGRATRVTDGAVTWCVAQEVDGKDIRFWLDPPPHPSLRPTSPTGGPAFARRGDQRNSCRPDPCCTSCDSPQRPQGSWLAW